MKNFSEKEYNTTEKNFMLDGGENEIIGQNHDNNGPFAKDSKSENFSHKNLDDTPHGRKIKPAIIALLTVCLYTVCLYIGIDNMPDTIRAGGKAVYSLVMVVIFSIIKWSRSGKSQCRTGTSFWEKIELAFVRVMFVILIVEVFSINPSKKQHRKAKHDPELAKKVAKADRKVVTTFVTSLVLGGYYILIRKKGEVECSNE